MQIPAILLPILEKITLDKNVGVEFWNELDGEDLNELLFALSSEIMIANLVESSIPIGFKQVAYIYHWESNCLFSGWYAIENYGDMLPNIIESYDEVGLHQEALALKCASKAWDSEEQDHDKVGKAYGLIENPYKNEDERSLYLANYFKENSNILFYSRK